MILVGLALTCLFGWLLLPSKIEGSALSRLSFSFAAGAAAISLQMFAYDLAGIGWSRLSLLAPWTVALLWELYRRRPLLGWGRRQDLGWRHGLFALGVLAPILIWLPYERTMPLTSEAWDAWAIWLFKAKAFYLDGGVHPFLERSGEFVTQPGYPLLIPLYGAFLYVWNGGVADQAAKLTSPCFFLATLGVFYYFARRSGWKSSAMVFTVFLAALPMFGVVAFKLAGYADTALSLYLVAATGFLYTWYREGRAIDLAAAALAATAAAWTKNEGQFFLLGVILLGAVGLARRRSKLAGWCCLLLPSAVVLIPWWAVRRMHGIEAAGFVPGLDFEPELFWVSLRTLVGKASELGSYNVTFYLFIAGLAAAVRLKPPGSFWIVPGLVFWQLLGALLAYATGRNDIDWWLGTSADRILAQIAPLALLPAALVMSHWRQQAAASPETPGQSRPAPPPGARRSRKRGRGSR